MNKKVNIIKTPEIKDVLIKDIKFLDFNRAVKMSHVDVLLNSMRDHGQLRIPVIVHANLGKGLKYYCIDGQNMITALIKAGVKNTKVILIKTNVKSEIVKIMARLNNAVRVWKLEDFVKAYSSLSIDSYNALTAHKTITGFTYKISAYILGGYGISAIKDGSFKADAIDADILTDNLVDLCSFMGTSNAKFMCAYINFFRSPSIKYDHKIFMTKIASHKKEFIIAHDITLIKQQFEKIYG